MINDMDLKLSIGKKYHTNMNQAGMILYKMELERKMYAFPGHNLVIPVLILFVADLFRSIIVIFFLLPMSKKQKCKFCETVFSLVTIWPFCKMNVNLRNSQRLVTFSQLEYIYISSKKYLLSKALLHIFQWM